MFRFYPDALLVLLLSLAAYCVVRAQERASTRWLVLAGVCVGFGFLAKMMQAFVVLPGFALVYLVTAPTPLGRRLWQLVLAGEAVEAWPRLPGTPAAMGSATVGSNNAAGFQLATELPVMAVGGFNGTDPAPTLADFQRYAKEGKIHYFVGGGMGMGRRTGVTTGGSDDAARIAAWVQENFTARTVGGVTLYDLTAG
ncbi:glycosyltransferase family 39 protein [Nonomuraea sp. NPDC049152]|uniref:glycosyltransferase family 39 protein n=1 Tax=Nonomuraea sp. NPDC049152 TaxID=3154350 RepID=UPI0033DB3099